MTDISIILFALNTSMLILQSLRLDPVISSLTLSRVLSNIDAGGMTKTTDNYLKYKEILEIKTIYYFIIVVIQLLSGVSSLLRRRRQ